MLFLAWNTFRDRWPVFVGAIVTVCLGVALVQSSLLALLAAATASTPRGLSAVEALALRNAYDGVVVLTSMQLALASFVAVFIVSSTFAFTVAQRRVELALLRLTGAARGQVRSLLVGEALLLGSVGSTLGVVLGLPVTRLQVWTLERLDFVPAGFEAPWRWWVVLLAWTVGTLIAVLGVLAASRRASRVRPLEAMRETGKATRVMTVSRWVLGLLFTIGGLVLLSVLPAGDTALPGWFIQLTPFIVSVPLVVGLSALAPLIVPLTGRLLGVLARGPLSELAVANLRSDAQRSAATAAPVMVLFAFVVSISTALGSVGEADREHTQRTLQGDLVVTADRPIATELSGVEGVAVVSEETLVLFELEFDEQGAQWREAHHGLVADPSTYARTRDVDLVAGDLTELSGPTVAVSPGVWERDWQVGDTLRLLLDGEERDVPIVALLPPSLSEPYFLLSPDLLPSDTGPWEHLVQVADGADERAVRAELAAFGEVNTLEQWVSEAADTDERTTLNIMIVLLGVTMLYTVIAMVNAVVIATSSRRREFATARVTGLSRGQVLRVALWESQAAVAIGVLLGGLAAAASIAGVSAALQRLLGLTVISVPWPLLIALVIGTALTVALTSIASTLSATRVAPIRLVASRE